MSHTEQIMDRFTTQQGWDRDTQLELALRYIEDQQSPDGWEDFLTGIAETENSFPEAVEEHLMSHAALSEDDLIRHLEAAHGVDPNTITDDDDPQAIHERAHDPNDDSQEGLYGPGENPEVGAKPTYRVTASVMFDYDPADGLVKDAEEARQDVVDMISSGDLTPGQYEITVTENNG